MRALLGWILLAALVVAAAWWAASLPGHVAFSIGDTSVETSPAIAAASLLLLFAALYALLRLVIFLLATPRNWRAWRNRRRRAAGDDAVTETLLALAGADADGARAAAARARRLLGDTPQTLLHAAEAARLAGREDEAAAIYQRLTEREDAGFLGYRGLFRQAMARENWNRAALLSASAEELNPGGTWLRAERTQLAVRTGNWALAHSLAGPDSPATAFAVAEARAEPDPSRALRLARRAWKNSPDFVPAILTYASALRATGHEAKARDLIRECWPNAPHPELAAFALAPVTSPETRLADATWLVARNPAHPESHMLLARLALEAGQPAEARNHAHAARTAGLAERRLFLLLADIEKREKGDTQAGREALMHAATAESDRMWRCEACGTGHNAWQPACPVCHTAGRILWSNDPMPRLLGPAEADPA